MELPMDFEDIVVEAHEGWLELEIRRPEKHNALREQTAREMLAVLDEVDSQSGIHGLIIQGGEKVFCSGIDASEFAGSDASPFDFYRFRRRARNINRLFRELTRYTKPVVVAVEGAALGGGFELALLSDIVIAGENARFALPECKLGIMPGGGGTQTLPRIVGRAFAKELIWTGRRLAAQEALSRGIVNHVVPAGQALDRARTLMREIGESAPLAVMLSKAAIDRTPDTGLREGIDMEGDASFMLYFSDDKQEGMAAFREKRKPRFANR